MALPRLRAPSIAVTDELWWSRVLGGPLPRFVQRRVVVVTPGAEHPYDESERHDAIVVLKPGDIELACTEERRLGISPGSVVFPAGLPNVTIRTPRPKVLCYCVRLPAMWGGRNKRPEFFRAVGMGHRNLGIGQVDRPSLPCGAWHPGARRR
jgi:hypothetical protein